MELFWRQLEPNSQLNTHSRCVTLQWELQIYNHIAYIPYELYFQFNFRRKNMEFWSVGNTMKLSFAFYDHSNYLKLKMAATCVKNCALRLFLKHLFTRRYSYVGATMGTFSSSLLVVKFSIHWKNLYFCDILHFSQYQFYISFCIEIVRNLNFQVTPDWTNVSFRSIG